jgi:hypothetical protein
MEAAEETPETAMIRYVLLTILSNAQMDSASLVIQIAIWLMDAHFTHRTNV